MSGLRFYRVEAQHCGTDADGWGHSAPGSIMTIGATDHYSAARMVSHAIFGVIGHGWVVKHTYALVYEVTAEEAPFGRLADDAGTWVRVTYRYGGIETVGGHTYAEVKYEINVHGGVSWE